MLVGEKKNLFNNIVTFRGLLKESVGESIISDAIKDQEYLYLYYKGDGVESTGYRTVKPYILGTRQTKKDGAVKVFRGWQIEGDSESQHKPVPDSGKPRMGHEKFHDDNLNKTVPGWREFRLDRVLSVYPTGNTFKTDKLPKPYKGNLDSVITSVDVAIPTTYKPEQKPIRTVTADKFLKAANIGNRVEHLYNTVKNVKKRSPSKTFVYVDDKGGLKFTYSDNFIRKLSQDRILGNLQELYNDLVLPQKARGDNFHDLEKRKSYKYL